jgi:hypothetical protein
MSSRARIPFLLLSISGLIAVASTARAETTTASGASYASLCAARGVPLPPEWGVSTGNWTYAGTFGESYPGEAGWDSYTAGNGNGGGNVYYRTSTSPPGICVIVAHTQRLQFDVICQGASGKACFWEGEKTHVVPLQAVTLADTNPATTDYVAGGAALAGVAEACTNCHAGENAFITHYTPTAASHLGGAFHATNLRSQPYWNPGPSTPTSWYDPIIPAGWPQNPGPGVFTGAPASTSSAGCLTCHTGGGIGYKFPSFSAETAGACKILERVTLRSGNTTGMSPSNTCNPNLNNCAGHTDPFVAHVNATLCAQPARVNLAAGRPADQSSLFSPGTPGKATDGIDNANWSTAVMAHTLNNSTISLNNPFGGTWLTTGGSLTDGYGALVGNGQSVFKLQSGQVHKFNFNTQTWNWTNGAAVTEMSISASNTLWALAQGSTFRYNAAPNNWTLVHTTSFSHIAAGDGDHPWTISSDGKTVYRFDGTAFQQQLTAPWAARSCGPAYQSSHTLTRVVVGADEDVWLVDSVGNAFHRVGGVGWEQANCNMMGTTTGEVNAIGVRNAFHVWATTNNPSGLFNWDVVNRKWQRHCPKSSCTPSSATFRHVSVGLQDNSVWTTNNLWEIYQLDESLAVNRNDSSTVNYSLQKINGGVPSPGFRWVAAVGGTSGFNGNVFAAQPNGAVWMLNGHSGKLPLNGGAWWFVDLGNYFHVDQVKIFNRDDGLAGRLSGFRIAYFTGAAWALGSDQTNTVATASNLAMPINVSFNTQYLMIQKTNSDYLTLAEVQVFGQPTPVPQF